MIKKTITFEDLDGNKITEDFYFHLKKSDIAEMELSHKGGLTEYIKKISAEEDGEKLVKLFKDLLTRTIGERSPDNRKFIQNEEITNNFIQTDAYSELFLELSSNAEQAAAFVSGLVPASMQEDVKKKQAETQVALPAVSDSQQSPSISLQEEIEKKFEDPSWIPSDHDLRNMSRDQMQRAWLLSASRNSQTLPPAASDPLA